MGGLGDVSPRSRRARRGLGRGRTWSDPGRPPPRTPHLRGATVGLTGPPAESGLRAGTRTPRRATDAGRALAAVRGGRGGVALRRGLRNCPREAALPDSRWASSPGRSLNSTLAGEALKGAEGRGLPEPPPPWPVFGNREEPERGHRKSCGALSAGLPFRSSPHLLRLSPCFSSEFVLNRFRFYPLRNKHLKVRPDN